MQTSEERNGFLEMQAVLCGMETEAKTIGFEVMEQSVGDDEKGDARFLFDEVSWEKAFHFVCRNFVKVRGVPNHSSKVFF